MSRLRARTYDRVDCVSFRKTDEEFGGLSNMAPGFPLEVNGIAIRTSEVLYQACRFPHLPKVQRLVIDATSPMTAKMKSKPYRKDSRPDWDSVRVKVMRWCLRVKLAQNWEKFGALLLDTGDRPIVEDSRKDDFWGATALEGGKLVGANVLGRLLMELRESLRGPDTESLRHVEAPPIPDFMLYAEPIRAVEGRAPGVRVGNSPFTSQRGSGREERMLRTPSLSPPIDATEAGSTAASGTSTPPLEVPDAHRTTASAAHSPKRLIEVDLPIKRISAHARREKSTSTITGVHLWWARRPLAACRAVVCASLWPDPADPECPPAFADRAREALLKFAAHARADPSVATLCSDSWSIWLHVDELLLDATTDDGRRGLRDLLFTFIGDFANPRATSQLRFVETARSLTRAAHEVLAESQSAYPIVLDPFAGGASIPLEALRVGASALAGDINPVALLINDVLVRLAPAADSEIRERIMQTARPIARRASQRLAALYPQRPGRVPVAYLWARTVLSEAPGAGEMPVEVPLIRSMWLSKRAGNLAALRWVRDSKRAIISDATDVAYADGTQRRVLRPRLEIFRPVSHAEVEAGTASGGGVVCPVTEYKTPKDRVRVQLTPRRGGTRDARLLAVATRPTAGNGREFQLPDESDAEALRGAEGMFAGLSDVVDEPLPGGRVWKNNPFRIHNYGMTSWGDLFTHRQHVALSILAEAVAHTSVEPPEDRGSGLIHSVLALTVARLADHMNSGCTWNPGGEKLQHLFSRQAVPMVWDFCEANPFGGSVGDWLTMVEGAVDALDFVPVAAASGDVFAASAEACPAPDDSVDAMITDPPYYDAVPYADLSEFFYVWLRRCAPRARASWFAAPLVDRRPEIVLDQNRAKDAAFYVRSMTAAFSEGRRVTKPAGLGVVVFAHKSTAGWEALLQAVLDAGWIITASWPIDTELATRVRAMSSAALASSVHLVCRPRENPDGTLRTDAIGDWRDVLAELPKRIHEWMPRLAEEGVVGADAIFACLGPALEVFSRYSRVEKASGEQVTLKEYLEHVWAAVAKEALSVIFAGAETSGFEEDARLTAMWLWTLSTGGGNGKVEGAPGDEDESEEEEDDGNTGKKPKLAGFALEYDAARKIAQGLGAHLEGLTSLVEVKGETARLLPVAERTRALFGKDESDAPTARRRKKAQQMALGFAEELEEAEETGGWGQKGAPKAGHTVLDRVHQSMILFAAGRGEALRRFLVDEGAGRDARFWRLAQALAALYPTGTDERRWVEGVLTRKKGLGF